MKYHWTIIQISFLYILYTSIYIMQYIYLLYIHLILILICVWTFERDLYWSTCLDAFPWWDTIWLWRDLPRPWRQLMWPRGSKFKFNGWSCWQFRVQIVLVNDMFFMIQRSFCYFFCGKSTQHIQFATASWENLQLLPLVEEGSRNCRVMLPEGHFDQRQRQ